MSSKLSWFFFDVLLNSCCCETPCYLFLFQQMLKIDLNMILTFSKNLLVFEVLEEFSRKIWGLKLTDQMDTN